MQILFDVHQKRWETLGEPGAFKTQWFRDMFLASAKLFAEKDWLRLYFLTADDKPTATLLALEYDQKMYANIYGFNPIYSTYGVGNLTTMKVLERCIEKKIKEFDFMQGDEPYKFRWTTKYRRNFNIQFANNKPTSKLIRLGIQAVNRTKLRGLLKRFVFT
jgi:CelD/BcsL family acetyltransferase involved in cellulose biosynthesis